MFLLILLLVALITYIILLCLLLNISTIGQGNKNDDSSNNATNPDIRPTWLWFGIQLLPSPQWSTRKEDGLAFGLQWQVTPLLYSFGINKKMNPWRYFISEPLTRQSGSIEIYFSPEYLSLENKLKHSWLFRGGARIYFPLWHKGEYLSFSLSSSYYNYNGQNGFSYEGGVYLFAGFLGIQTTYSPTFKNSEWKFTLRIRVF